jgi:hypothetical protein
LIEVLIHEGVMFRPTIAAILCALGLSIATPQAGENTGIGDSRMPHRNDPMPLQGIDNNQLAADSRIMARVPGGHEAYGWRYPNAFDSSPVPMTTPASRSTRWLGDH